MRYSGADVLVQTSFVIPVPIPFVGSTGTSSYNHVTTSIYMYDLFVSYAPHRHAVKYQFETEGGDIAFGLTFLSNAHSNHAAADVISLARLPSDQELITGAFKAPSEGTLVFKWSNEYSWFRSKNLSYRIELQQVIGHK
jgi:hypothetical protein